ncbi:hypothetical protein J2S66_000747 [Saccharothrix longispora]|uniref:Uncharacterized protein n=1 Tax=Saccharothrix longispora TaxID=33920 RepID=A0ABU1PQ52_9PSEU|nr:hypothetical protein [Saccharothrix longispora]
MTHGEAREVAGDRVDARAGAPHSPWDVEDGEPALAQGQVAVAVAGGLPGHPG